MADTKCTLDDSISYTEGSTYNAPFDSVAGLSYASYSLQNTITHFALHYGKLFFFALLFV